MSRLVQPPTHRPVLRRHPASRTGEDPLPWPHPARPRTGTATPLSPRTHRGGSDSQGLKTMVGEALVGRSLTMQRYVGCQTGICPGYAPARAWSGKTEDRAETKEPNTRAARLVCGAKGRLVETCPGTGTDGREPESYRRRACSPRPRRRSLLQLSRPDEAALQEAETAYLSGRSLKAIEGSWDRA